jgi:hypothetical protein
MIHTIGVSFTAEMAVKAAYEETIGRATAWWRGPSKTPQDQAVAAMAIDYATFLRQTPWYEYPFMREAGKLWSAPVGLSLRGWERRFGIGFEFAAKTGYAKVIGAAAAAAPAQLVIRTVVSGLDEAGMAGIPGVTIIGARAGGVEIETPRYDLYTRILVEIARRGGTITEIAGNDDIMVTMTVPSAGESPPPHGRIILRMRRDGFASDRLLVDLKVTELALFLNKVPLGDPGIEHVFDY